MHTLGRKDAGLTTYFFFLKELYRRPTTKVYITVLRNGLWKKLWVIGIYMRKYVENEKNIISECASTTVMLDGEISKYVDTSQGIAQGCTLSPDRFRI